MWLVGLMWIEVISWPLSMLISTSRNVAVVGDVEWVNLRDENSLSSLRKLFSGPSPCGQTMKMSSINLFQNVIYMLQCTQPASNPTGQQEKCQAFYIGLTTQKARERMNGHRQSVKNIETEKPLADHAASHSISKFQDCYKSTILREIKTPVNYAILRQYELAYQHILKSRKAQGRPGLNIR